MCSWRTAAILFHPPRPLMSAIDTGRPHQDARIISGSRPQTISGETTLSIASLFVRVCAKTSLPAARSINSLTQKERRKTFLGKHRDFCFDSRMPLLKLETTVLLSEDKQKQLLTSLSRAVAATIGKPEQYVMVTISQAAVIMSGKQGDAAFVDIRSIGGLSDDVNRKLSQQVCKLLTDSIGVPSDRVYLNFTNMEAGNWGWNGSTFG